VSTVVVGAALASRAGSGGGAWVRLSWVRGLEQLGLNVRFAEELGGEDADPAAVAWFGETTRRFGFEDRATLLHRGETVAGAPLEELLRLAPEATLVNISGHLTLPALVESFRRRVFVDLDPGFTQFWHEAGLADARVGGHDVYFTLAERIGAPDCPIPTAGIDWHPITPAVVLEDWPRIPPAGLDRFTTIAAWRGPFGPIERDGHTYGLKVHEFRKLIDLPRRSPQNFELALDIHPGDAGDLEALREHGWRLVDPRAVAGDPESFRAYVQGSGAEFSVAQGIYVDTHSGWFSDRTTCYLASGRPALVQDTGFSRTLPTGNGLIAFRTPDEAATGAAAIAARYEEHCEAARLLAEEHFDARLVLGRFCERAGIG
jgi:hypothetical protein